MPPLLLLRCSEPGGRDEAGIKRILWNVPPANLEAASECPKATADCDVRCATGASTHTDEEGKSECPKATADCDV
eukprot:3804037-Alexandrium_andersonii.AAC.1